MDEPNYLRTGLNDFWTWAGVTIQEYGRDGLPYNIEEDDYPKWIDLLCIAKKVIANIKNQGATEAQINDILEIMALSNESEVILDECEMCLCNQKIKTLLEIGTSYSLSNARWQIAELIGRKGNEEWQDYLVKLIADSDKYVQRRALLSLSRIDSLLATEISSKKILDEDYMLRLVSLRILFEASSSMLNEALIILENDPNRFVLNEVAEIKSILNL